MRCSGWRPALAGVLAGGFCLALPVAATADDGRTPGASGHTQVSVLPVGGAASGGGAQDRGTDTALIIGVGVAAVAGSLGLFAAAHAAARRA